MALALALTAGALVGIALGGAALILTIEILDGRQEFAW